MQLRISLLWWTKQRCNADDTITRRLFIGKCWTPFTVTYKKDEIVCRICETL